MFLKLSLPEGFNKYILTYIVCLYTSVKIILHHIEDEPYNVKRACCQNHSLHLLNLIALISINNTSKIIKIVIFLITSLVTTAIKKLEYNYD